MVEVRGLLGVQATGLIKHHPHCKGSPEEPHQGALFTVVLLHEKGASGLNPSLSYAVGLGATHLSKKKGLTLFLIGWCLQTDVWSSGGWGFCAHISCCHVEHFPKSPTRGHLLVHIFPAFSTLAASYIPLYLCLCVGNWISSSASERLFINLFF